MITCRAKAACAACHSLAILSLVVPARLQAQPGPGEQEVLARVTLSGESPRTARQMATAARLAEQGNWREAVEEYQRILAEAGDDLVPLDARHSVQARRLCHLRIAALPNEALRLYRVRVDPQAKKWLDQGTAERDPGLLRRLVDEAFCSGFTDQALDLLGDLAFERGDFEEAERWWRMLALSASEKERRRLRKDDLLYPDLHLDVARVRAKQILARLFRGQPGCQEELKAFIALHGAVQGHLTGKDGKYGEILQALLSQQEALHAPPPTESWPTFAGAPGRNQRLPQARGRLARFPHLDGPTWTVRLDTGKLQERGDDSSFPGRVPGPASAARSLAFYPVIVGDKVLVAGERFVTAFDLLTGRRVPQLHYDLAADLGEADASSYVKLPAPADASYTLSATDERVFARLGTPLIGPIEKGTAAESYLVCLNLEPTAAGLKRWQVSARSSDGSPAVFEGAPLVHEGKVYVAIARLAGVQTQTAVACYDTDSGALRWQRDLCATKEFKDNERRVRHHLLTLAGPNLVYCSHTGALCALDAATGRHAWSVRYASRGPKTRDGQASPRSLAPCLYADGRIYAAPLDLDHILCLDAITGRLLWESTPIEVVHLLGAARGRLIFSTVTPRKSIRALDLANGNPMSTWCQPPDDDLPSFGRGLIAGDWVLWPTSNGLHVLSLEDAYPVFFVDPNIRGNLAAANGCLVVAGLKELSAYVPAARLLHRRREDAKKNASSARAHYELAVAEADTGLVEEAVGDFLKAESLAGRNELYAGLELRGLAHQGRHRLLLDAAEQATLAKERDRADALLGQAAAKEFSASSRAEAVSRQAALWSQGGHPERGVAVWQTLLEDPLLSRGQLVSAQGLPQSAAVVAADRISALIQSHGREVYRAIEQRALAIAHSAAPDKQKEVLGRLGREFPNALITEQLTRLPDPKAVPHGPGPTLMQGLTLPLFRTWHVSAERARPLVSLSGMGDDSAVLLTMGSRGLTCRKAITGAFAWETSLPFEPCWATCHANVVIVAGNAGIQGHHKDDGTLIWSWYPTRPFAFTAVQETPPDLTDFQLAGGLVFFLQDGRRILALKADSGQVLWARWAPAGRLYLPDLGGRYSRLYHASDQGLLIQTSAGKGQILDTQTGQMRGEEAAAKTPWTRPPLAFDDTHVLLAPVSSRVLLMDLATGKQLWQFDQEQPVSLTGEAPELLSTRDHLMILVRRNYGSFLECLDPLTGKRRWPQPLFLGTHQAELESGALDPSAAYLVVDRTLCAYRLADARLIWRYPLPEHGEHWRISAIQDFLLVFPRARPSARWQNAWLGANLDFCWTPPSVQYFPILAIDSKTGTLVQQLNFPARAASASLRMGWSRSLLFLPQCRKEVLITDARAPAVHIADRRLTVALDGAVWGLAAQP